jgi:hypothetical protein
MNSTTKRSILRWIHVVLAIPILSYIYGPPSEVQQYASAVRLIFVPVLILSGFWMYAGVIFAVVGVTLWLGVIFSFLELERLSWVRSRYSSPGRFGR